MPASLRWRCTRAAASTSSTSMAQFSSARRCCRSPRRVGSGSCGPIPRMRLIRHLACLAAVVLIDEYRTSITCPQVRAPLHRIASGSRVSRCANARPDIPVDAQCTVAAIDRDHAGAPRPTSGSIRTRASACLRCCCCCGVDIITGQGNYGWRVYEGTRFTNNDPSKSGMSYIRPIYEFCHASDTSSTCNGKAFTGDCIIGGRREVNGLVPNFNFNYYSSANSLARTTQKGPRNASRVAATTMVTDSGQLEVRGAAWLALVQELEPVVLNDQRHFASRSWHSKLNALYVLQQKGMRHCKQNGIASVTIPAFVCKTDATSGTILLKPLIEVFGGPKTLWHKGSLSIMHGSITHPWSPLNRDGNLRKMNTYSRHKQHIRAQAQQDEDVKALQQLVPAAEAALRYTFSNKLLLLQALTHRSYCNENRTATGDNDALEWLGDSVLQHAISDWLYNSFAERSVHKLTDLRQQFVDTTACADYASRLGLPDMMRTGHGQATRGTNTKVSADCFEAVLGAMYLDSRSMSPDAPFVPIFRVLADVIPAFTGARDSTASSIQLLMNRAHRLSQASCSSLEADAAALAFATAVKGCIDALDEFRHQCLPDSQLGDTSAQASRISIQGVAASVSDATASYTTEPSPGPGPQENARDVFDALEYVVHVLITGPRGSHVRNELVTRHQQQLQQLWERLNYVLHCAERCCSFDDEQHECIRSWQQLTRRDTGDGSGG
ncbi:hypothetical protein JKP88DRAFT_263865 [Tribonema minus]|uniref:RNase III domain-containing protein n=1 Tax=Tribonema minus TaxID=303371 RepID=A0A835Z0E4_9STRA|nr:hypothetical protein JKP88DRAFT_263865 [Tribonema minus]